MTRAAALALTQGDPSGIGPEIAVKAWRARAPGDHPFFLLADPDHLAGATAALGLDVPGSPLSSLLRQRPHSRPRFLSSHSASA